jgi:ABC-type nitrate/sulfonate/bicarbonate transport system substrate-binding protein
VLSGQVDVGWAGAPFGIEAMEKGQIRSVWKANAVPELDQRTIRVMIANSEDLKQKGDIYGRFLAGYEETLTWAYSTPDGLKAYAEWAGLSEGSAKRALDEFLPRAALEPRKIIGIEQALDDAVATHDDACVSASRMAAAAAARRDPRSEHQRGRGDEGEERKDGHCWFWGLTQGVSPWNSVGRETLGFCAFRQSAD